MRSATEILRQAIGIIPFATMNPDQGAAIIKAINEARIELVDEIKAKVVENRNLAHVNCLEESKQAFNQVINIIENTKRDKIK